MKKNTTKLTKKAQWSTMQKFIVAAVLIILLLIIGKSTIFGSDAQLKYLRIATTNDYDDDNIKDANDDSPCVFGEEIVLVSGTKEVYYYVTEAIENNGEYVCPEGETTYEGKILTKVKDSESNKHICALSSTQCDELIEEEYEMIKNQQKN